MPTPLPLPFQATLKRSQVILGSTDPANPCTLLTQATQTQADIDAWPAIHTLDYLNGKDARDAIIAQASSNQVCILSRDQHFSQALPFWDAFSSSEDTDRNVSCVCVGSSVHGSGILVAAAMDHRIAVWCSSSSTTSTKRWKVHSTLMINDGPVTSIDIVNGHLLVGSSCTLSLWRLESSEIPIWRRFWTKSVPAPIRIARFSTDASIIAAVAQGGQYILLWQYQPRATQPPTFQQRLFHPDPVANFVWRQPPEPTSQSDVLISYSVDGTARVWAPVIDEPTQLRLWCTILCPARPDSAIVAASFRRPAFYLDPHVVCSALRINIGVLQRELQMIELGIGKAASSDQHIVEMETDLKRTRLRRLEQLVNETPDMFVCFEPDGLISILAVANIDRRPPSLLQTFTVLRCPLPLPISQHQISSLCALPLYAAPDCSSGDAMMTLQLQTKSGSVMSFSINPSVFFDGRGQGIVQNPFHPCGPPLNAFASSILPRRHQSRIRGLCRSADGRNLISWSASETLHWTLKCPDGHGRSACLTLCESQAACSLVCQSYDGKLSATFSPHHGLRLHSMTGKAVTILPVESCEFIHLAFGHTSAAPTLFAISPQGVIRAWQINDVEPERISSLASCSLPLGNGQGTGLSFIDSNAMARRAPDEPFKIITGNDKGVVEVWQLGPTGNERLHWSRANRFSIGPTPIRMAQCSPEGLYAFVSTDEKGGQQLIIIDSKTTSFSSGEEYKQVFDSNDPIVDLDWSPSSNSESCLAVGFRHHVLILSLARKSVVSEGKDGACSRWRPAAHIELGECTASHVRSICWLADERLVVASASILYVYGPYVAASQTAQEHLVETLTRMRGPVMQYHPSFLHQSALWHKMGLAKEIIRNMGKAVSECSADDIEGTWHFQDAPLDLVLQEAGTTVDPTHPVRNHVKTNGVREAVSIFDDEPGDEVAEDPFADTNIESLIRKLGVTRPPYLSDQDIQVLPVLIRTISEADRERRGMDESGLRYLLAFRLLMNLQISSKKTGDDLGGALSYRDCLWAFHSNNQEPLVAAIETAFRNKLTWPVARATGVFMWIRNPQMLRAQAEAVARAQFMSGDDRDPVKCSLLYFALGKRKVVHGLWKQAVWHPEQKKMLQFLSHDFDEDRWKSAAQKNAFALLSQRRYEFAASFFMLGDSLHDAINVCVRNLEDVGLAIALARIQEGCDDGPIFTELLRTKLLPLAFEQGDRWLGSWTFWMLKRRDLAVRIILTPLAELLMDADVASLLPTSIRCGNDNYEDASLALLFKQLKSKSLQTLKGLSGIPEKKEFDFVLHTNRLLRRIGCDAIGLSVLRNWRFEPPTAPSSATPYHKVSKQDLESLSLVDESILNESIDTFADLNLGDLSTRSTNGAGESASSPTRIRRRASQDIASPPSSPVMSRRRSSLLRRRSSIINDLDIGGQQLRSVNPSIAIQATRVGASEATGQSLPSDGTGEATFSQEPASLDADSAKSRDEKEQTKAPEKEQKKQGISVFKSAAASNSQQGAQEFDFGSFGF